MVTARRVAAHQDTADVVPQPLTIEAVVVNDFAARTLFVRLGDTVTGSAREAWQRGYNALRLLEDSGYSRQTIPDLWASMKGADRISHAAAGDASMLKFFFEPGNTAYSQLVGKPRLYALVTVNRATGYFMGCKFLHRP
jgi:hypothetical protein